MNRARWTMACMAILLAGLTGCDEGGVPGVATQPGGGGTLAIPANGGDGQIGAPGAPLDDMLRVIATSGGQPAVGVEVVWTTADGALSPSTITTTASGTAVTRWTLPDTAGSARVVRASARLGSGGRAVEFVAYAVPAEHAVVEVADDGFDVVRPADPLRIPAGTTVTWVWPSTARNHNVAPSGGGSEPARSGPPADGPAVHSWTFANAGTYGYGCETHPADTAEVIVEAP